MQEQENNTVRKMRKVSPEQKLTYATIIISWLITAVTFSYNVGRIEAKTEGEMQVLTVKVQNVEEGQKQLNEDMHQMREDFLMRSRPLTAPMSIPQIKRPSKLKLARKVN